MQWGQPPASLRRKIILSVGRDARKNDLLVAVPFVSVAVNIWRWPLWGLFGRNL
jgi:hypothetical protein